MTVPLEVRALIKDVHDLEVFRAEAQAPLKVKICIAIGRDDAGRDNGEEIMDPGVFGDVVQFGHVIRKNSGLESNNKIRISLSDLREAADCPVEPSPASLHVSDTIVDFSDPVHGQRKDEPNPCFPQ